MPDPAGVVAAFVELVAARVLEQLRAEPPREAVYSQALLPPWASTALIFRRAHLMLRREGAVGVSVAGRRLIMTQGASDAWASRLDVKARGRRVTLPASQPASAQPIALSDQLDAELGLRRPTRRRAL